MEKKKVLYYNMYGGQHVPAKNSDLCRCYSYFVAIKRLNEDLWMWAADLSTPAGTAERGQWVKTSKWKLAAMQGFRPLLPLPNPTEEEGKKDKEEEEEEDKCSLSYSEIAIHFNNQKCYKIKGLIKRQQNSWWERTKSAPRQPLTRPSSCLM